VQLDDLAARPSRPLGLGLRLGLAAQRVAGGNSAKDLKFHRKAVAGLAYLTWTALAGTTTAYHDRGNYQNFDSSLSFQFLIEGGGFECMTIDHVT
jgi:hypothetical protein